MGMTVGGGKGPSANINVTPMIDVLLVLLIIFMIITPYYGEKALIPQPAREPAVNTPEILDRTVVLQLHFVPGNKPELKLNDEPVTWEQLKFKLRLIYETRQEKVIFVKGDSQLDWQPVAEVIDIAHNSGVQNVGLLTDKMQAGQ